MASALFRELRPEEIGRVVTHALHTQVRSARLLTGGLFNTTYLVDTADQGRAVLRVGPVNRHLLMPFEHRLMEAETQVYTLCAQAGIPVSQVLALDTSKAVIDRDYMLVRYIPSKPMNEVTLQSADKARICEDVGRYTARMHAIHAPRFGRITDVAQGGGFARWSECMLDELHSWESVADAAELYAPEEIARMEAVFLRAAAHLDAIDTPCLVHTDLWFGNILIDTQSPRPEVAAIIDADRALWGDPEAEYSMIGWMHREDAFWKGYGRRPGNDTPSLIRRGIYELLVHLWNSYVYKREYNMPEEAMGEKRRALEQLKALESMS